jgi:hypothetical protein
MGSDVFLQFVPRIGIHITQEHVGFMQGKFVLLCEVKEHFFGIIFPKTYI